MTQKLIAKFSPFSLLDPATPTLFLGAETSVNDHWAFELDYGVKTNTGVFHWNVDKSRYRYFKLRSEVKYYFPFRKNRAYVGMAFFFVPQSYDNAGGTYYEKSGNEFDYDKAHVNKNIFGLCLKTAYVRRLSSRFSFEVFAGVGARFVNFQLSNMEGKRETFYSLKEGFYIIDTAGWQTRLHIESGVKINYMVVR